jgi:hypothetical protein
VCRCFSVVLRFLSFGVSSSHPGSKRWLGSHISAATAPHSRGSRVSAALHCADVLVHTLNTSRRERACQVVSVVLAPFRSFVGSWSRLLGGLETDVEATYLPTGSWTTPHGWCCLSLSGAGMLVLCNVSRSELAGSHVVLGFHSLVLLCNGSRSRLVGGNETMLDPTYLLLHVPFAHGLSCNTSVQGRYTGTSQPFSIKSRRCFLSFLASFRS